MRVKYNDNFNYTNGRWLIHDEWYRVNRYLNINFEALRIKVLELITGATSIVRTEKLEGAFNRVFILETDNGHKVVVKFPFDCAGPTSLTTHSEVATMMYIKQHTNIPIPDLLDWCDFPQNEIGGEYIIMKYVSGVPLPLVWPTMSSEQKRSFVEHFYLVIRQLLKLKFPFFGSLYLSHWPIPRTGFTKNLGGGYRIGPHCGDRYWGLANPEARCYDRVDPNRGPWLGFNSWSQSLVDSGISHIPMDESHENPKPWYHGSISEHLYVLDLTRRLVPILWEYWKSHRSIRRPMLAHPDMQMMGNILVEPENPTVITSIIDWQSAAVEPAFLQMRTLPFVEVASCGSSECAEKFQANLKAGDYQLYNSLMVDTDLVTLYWECDRIWTRGAAPYEKTLSRIAERWSDLGFPPVLEREWPIPDLTADQRTLIDWNYWGFKEAKKLQELIAKLLRTRLADGLVSLGNYEEKVHQNRMLFRAYLHYILWKNSQGSHQPFSRESQLREVWPYDL